MRAQVGILDFGVMPDGGNPRAVIAATLQAVALADELGFGRYWLAEHHALRCAWGDPMPLVALLGAASERIRIGTGGTLLNAHAPVAVASDFAFLSWMFPGRVDLGLARGIPATNVADWLGEATTELPKDTYERRVRELLNRLRGEIRPPDSADPSVCASVPLAFHPLPECWVLGTTPHSARLAADLGTAFAYSLFHLEKPNVSAIEEYRDRFVPGMTSQPKLAIAVAGLCGESDHEVREQLANQLMKGRIWPTVVGTPQQCRESMLEVQHTYAPDLQIMLDLSSDPDARLRSIRLLATALDQAAVSVHRDELL